jgi:hypothetical protein
MAYMLNAILIALGFLAVATVLWQSFTSREERTVAGLPQQRAQGTPSEAWIYRLKRIQVASVIIGAAGIPAGFVVMVVTGSGTLTLIVASALPASGLVFGLCEVAKGIIEARQIVRGGRSED